MLSCKNVDKSNREYLMKKAFLMPVGLAATALMANNAGAMTQTKSSVPDEKGSSAQVNPIAERDGTTTHIAQYLKGDEKHELLVKKSDLGLIFAAHGSHSSHASHGSHRSGR
jgi:hypothetical protein